jgi:hypothetical protein
LIHSQKNLRASASNETKLKECVIDWLEISTVVSGLNTALNYLFGFLRVIPILLKKESNEDITKDQLISTLRNQDTINLLVKLMKINTSTLNVLQNILWQKPVETIEDALEKLNNYNGFNALASMRVFKNEQVISSGQF